MASAWVEKRQMRKSGVRHVVRYRIGGRESALLFGGPFPTQREAKIRRDTIAGELAALRVPNLRLLERQTAVRTLTTVAKALAGITGRRVGRHRSDAQRQPRPDPLAQCLLANQS